MKKSRLPFASRLGPVGLAFLLVSGGAFAELTLDSGFGTSGIAQVDIAAGADLARDIAEQADGDLVLVGRSRQLVGADTVDYVTLTRLDAATGAVDGSFGTDGIVNFLPGLTAQDGGGGQGETIAIQPADQKILVAGFWKDAAAADNQAFVARLDPTGALDPGFGTGGVVLLTPAGVTSPSAHAIALRSDGSIIVAGSATEGADSVGFVAALDGDGDPLPGFTTAVVQNPLAGGEGFRFNALAILAGDAILAGGGGGDFTLVQFTSAGVADAGFGTNGIASFNYLSYDTASGAVPSFDIISDIAVLGDGRVLFTGRAGTDSSFSSGNAVLARATGTGTLDESFGSAGYAPLADASQGAPEALGVRPSGDIVLVGLAMPPTQVSPNGLAVEAVAATPNITATGLTGLRVVSSGDAVGVGLVAVNGADTAFVAARFAATDVADGPDTVPDPFAFTTQSGVEPGIEVTSNAVAIGGIEASAPVSVSAGASYSIGCTATFTTLAGTIGDGDTVCVRANAASPDLTPATAQLTIGGIVGRFTVITGDATPDPITFVDQTDVATSTLITSAPVALTGLTTRTTVRVSGVDGSFSVGCTSDYTTQATKVDPGAQICVRHMSSAALGTSTSTVLQVGEADTVQGTFTSTTEGDTTPDAFDFVDQEDVAKSTVITSAPVTLTGFTSNAPISVSVGSLYSIGCTATYRSTASTVAPGATVCVRHTSSAAGGTSTTTTLRVGPGDGVSGTFTSTTAGTQDTTPDQFSFADQTNVPLGTVITSGAVTIGGFDTSVLISITGGTYSVGCTGSFTSNSSQLAPSTSVCVRHTSALTGGTATNTVLTVGGVSDTFTSTTLAGDAEPADFSFVDQTGVDQYEIITSAPVTITGIDIASPVSVTGGEYSIGCTSSFTAGPSNISNGATVCVRHRSSFDANASVSTTLQIGTTTGTFTSTTGTSDQTPDDFSFESQANVALNTVITSNKVTISGVDGPVRITLAGPTGSFGLARNCDEDIDTNPNGTVLENGDSFCVAVVSPGVDLASAVVTVTLGGSSPGTQKTATFTVTTGDTVPDAFSFVDQVGVALNDIVYANPITITGITAPSRVTISGNGEYQIDCNGSFTRLPGVVENDQTICVRQFAPGSLGTLTTTVLTVGGVSATFSTTTTTSAKPLPGSSAMDAWSLLLLVPLAARRRRPM